MNIFIDVRLCSYGYQGVGIYIENILQYLLAIKENTYYLAGYKEYLKKYEGLPNVKPIEFEAPIHSIKEQILGFKIKKDYKKIIDVFFFPYPTIPAAFYNTNFIVKLHDVTPFKFCYYFNPIKVILGYLITKIVSIKAKAIISVSESTKKDLIKYFGINEEKIKVIYDGVSDDFKMLDKKTIDEFKKTNCLKKYILFVGNREKSKNLLRLVKAVEIVRREFEVELLIIGRKYKSYEKIDKKLLSYGDWIKIVYNVPKEELIKYYNACEIYVQPSLNEGFGLPIVEAIKCGCVCTVSDIPIFREILDDKALYFNPYNVEDIAGKIMTLLKNEALKEELKSKNVKLINKFSWENCAKEILKLFQKVCKGENEP